MNQFLMKLKKIKKKKKMNQFLMKLKKIKNKNQIMSNFSISIIFFYHFLNICDEIKIGPFALK